MNKQNLNTNVNEDDLNHTFKNILLLEKLFISEINKIYEIEEGISIINHYIMSIANRAISLNRGFVTLAESNNYQTAISLMRLQIDNCLRLYAMSLSGNAAEFYEKVLNGEHIRNLKDRDGNKMTDNYLVTKIDKIFPKFESLYKKLSGHIHFSSEHFSFNNKLENDTYSISVGNVENLNIAEKVDYTFNMFWVSKDLLNLITDYRMEIKK
jgi:RNA recognition motif-containing protein